MTRKKPREDWIARDLPVVAELKQCRRLAKDHWQGGSTLRARCSGVAKLCFRNIPPILFDAKSPPVCPLDLSLWDRPTERNSINSKSEQAEGRGRQ